MGESCSKCGMSRDIFQELKVAIINNDIDMLEGFYKFSPEEMRDVDVNANIFDSSKNFNTLLNVAVKHRNSDAVEFLLNLGADPNLKHDVNYQVTFPLLQAISNKDLVIASKLINKGANIDQYTSADVPIIRAVQLRSFDIATLLVNKGADVNADIYSNTALIHSITNNDFDLVKLLVENGANINTISLKQPLSVAINANNIRITEYLLRNNADFSVLNQNRIDIKEEHLPLLQTLVDFRIDLSQKPALLKTAIQQASFPLINFLYSNGLTLKHLEISPYLYLTKCDNENYTKMVKFLTSKAEQINKCNSDTNTILTSAMRFVDTEAKNHRLKTLIEEGADPNFKAINGRYPLELAVMQHTPSSVKLLLSLGADPNLLDVNFVADQNVEITQLLIEGGYDNTQQLRESVFLKSLQEIVKKKIIDSTFSLFNPEGQKAIIELKTNPSQIKEIANLVANKNFYFFVRLVENQHKIDSIAAVKKLFFSSLKLDNNNGLFSAVNVQKLQLTATDATLQRFVTDDMIDLRSMQMLTDEIIALHQLVKSKVFTNNQALNIGKYISYDNHLAATCPGFCIENIVDYFFNILDNPSIDPNNKFFKQGIKYILSQSGQQYITELLPATAIKQIAGNNQEYYQQATEDMANLPMQSQYLPLQRIINGESSNVEEVANSVNNHGLNNIAVEWLNFMSMQLFSRSKIGELQQLLSSNEIKIPWFRAVFDAKASRAVKFKLHPDKNGSAEDFKLFSKISLELKDGVMNQQENWMKLIVNSNAKVVDVSKVIQAGVTGYKYIEQPGIDLGFKLLSYILPLVASASGAPQLANHANQFAVAQQAYSMGIESALISAFISFGIGELAKVNSGYSIAISSFLALTSLYNAATSVADLLTVDAQESLSTKASDILTYFTSNNYIVGVATEEYHDSVTYL